MPKTIRKIAHPPKLERKKRVAAYARVSSGKDAMLHSLSSQVAYYSSLIQKHGDWEYAGVYADEAMTGTKVALGHFEKLLVPTMGGDSTLDSHLLPPIRLGHGQLAPAGTKPLVFKG